MYFTVSVNTTRGGIKGHPDEAFRRTEARKHVRLFLVPKNTEQAIWDSMIPDYLVTDSMVDRFLEIDPPELRILSTFDVVIEEIERTYVLGLLFSALSAAVVTIERTLNEARMRLHEHVSPKIKDLWGKGPLNEWERNIAALEQLGLSAVGSARRTAGAVCRPLRAPSFWADGNDRGRRAQGCQRCLRAVAGAHRFSP